MKYAELMDGAKELSGISWIDFNDPFQFEFTKRLVNNINFEATRVMDADWDETPEWIPIPLDLVMPAKTLETIWVKMDLALKEYAVCVAFQDLLASTWNNLDVESFSNICLWIEKSDFSSLDNIFKQVIDEGNSRSPLTEFSKKAIGIKDINELTRILESILVSRWNPIILDLPPVVENFINEFKYLIWFNLPDRITRWNNNPQTTH